MKKARPSFDALDSVTALPAARNGDMDSLASKVRSGSPLSDAEKAFIADFLTGRAKIDATAHQRQETLDAHILNGLFVLRIQVARGGPLDVAYQEAGECLGVSRRSLQTAVQIARTNPRAIESLRRFEKRLEEARREGQLRKWSLLELALQI